MLLAAQAGAEVLAGPPTLLLEESPGHLKRIPLETKPCSEPDCVEAYAAEPAFTAKLKWQLGVIELSVEWTREEWLHRLALELPFPKGEVNLIGRDARPHPTKLAYLGRFAPKWVTIERASSAAPPPRSDSLRSPIGSVTLLADDSIDELAVKGTTITIELDSAAARPFTHDARCAHKWQDPNSHVAVPLRLRVPGETVSARLQLVDRPIGHPIVPLVKSLWPDGRRAALVFTDHADQTTLRTLTVLAKGFADHHLVFTKALFAKGSDRPQLDDPQMVALADEMAKDGDEIVPHSATPKPDDRQVTAQALERFSRWLTRTWIDHQPETNCEAFGDEGYQSGGKFGIADLLAAHHYEYVWAEVDASPGDLNLLSPAHLGERVPVLWPLGRVSRGGPETLWMFRTMWAFLEAKRFYAMYGSDRLDRLEKERGLHIAHTYLDTYHPRRTRFGLRNVIVPADKSGVPGGPGAVKLDPRMDAMLAGIEQHQQRGTLWVPTLAQLADRMRLVASVTVTVKEDGFVVHAPKAVPAMSFVVPKRVEISVNGKEPEHVVESEDETSFFIDLPEGDTEIQLK
jgi:hypothetical protein